MSENISNIKRIVNTYGSFSVADVDGESSPCIDSMGKDNFQLAERFSADGVEAITYVHETEVSSDFIEYENLDDNIIADINLIAVNFESDNTGKVLEQ